ncbi:MAG: acetate--CoA ligase family protein [Candidatus Nanopelagicales bacterium]
MTNNLDLRPLWAAQTIAVVGATERVGAIGRLPIEYLTKFGFEGFIAPVNPKGGTILGLPAFQSMAEIPQHIELALIMVPASSVREAVKDCAAAGVDVAIVMSSGFGEVDPDGQIAQQELVDIARADGMRLVGPNCIGSVGGAHRVMATFSPVFSSESTPLPAGNVALVSQSGALGFGALSLGLERGVPIGIAITTGNEADVTAVEVAAQLAQDPEVDAVAMYVESLGNMDQLIEVAGSKPIAILKAGRSVAGAAAAASHTGALASPDKVVSAVLTQNGIARANNIDELLDIAALFASEKKILGPAVGIVTTSGGSGILAVDALESEGLSLAELSAETVTALEEIVPSYGNATNPVDVTAAVMAESGLFERCVNRLSTDPSVNAIVACFAVLVGKDVDRIAQALGAVRENTGLPVVAVRTGAAALAPEGAQVLKEAGIPVYPTPERAVAALRALVTINTPERKNLAPATQPGIPVPQKGASEKDLKELFAQAGLPIPESLVVTSGSDVVGAVGTVGGRAVFKAVVPGLLHKSDAGGVVLDVSAEKAVDTFARLQTLGGDVLVERFVPGGVEVLVGVSSSPMGRVLTVGVGGVLTEIVASAAVRVLPVSKWDITQMISETTLDVLLAGARGAPAADREALVIAIDQLAQGVRDWPVDCELDINPVTVLEHGCWFLDAAYVEPPTQ